jgi:hypothetical protein
MSKARQSLKSQDVLLLLKLLSFGLEKRDRPSQADIAETLGLSQPEVVHCFSRLKRSGLLSSQGEIKPMAMIEFIVHGLKYVFPAELSGGMGRGILTCASAIEELKKNLGPREQADQNYVWPSSDGSSRGILVEPIYSSATFAALHDKRLHEFLALVDSIRLGGVRERRLAQERIEYLVRQCA